MCRFVAYKGSGILMADLILEADHSLIKQSYKSRERSEPLNGDGFGVGWYAENDPVPCFFTSVIPAWSNSNLHRLSKKIRSSCFFAHVRAATGNLLVSEVNCHPFRYGKFLWMHNGLIGPYKKIKRRMREFLSDELYDMVKGTSDSEHAFAVFLRILGSHIENPSVENLRDAMNETLFQINEWCKEVGDNEPSFLNFAVTDGDNLVVSHYVSDVNEEPPSLYLSFGSSFELYEGDFRMMRDERGPKTAIVSSEPLTNVREDWVEVPKNNIVTISGKMAVEMSPVS